MAGTEFFIEMKRSRLKLNIGISNNIQRRQERDVGPELIVCVQGQ